MVLFPAGVPMEVMGLMLGDFVDDYTVRVVDVNPPISISTSDCIDTLAAI